MSAQVRSSAGANDSSSKKRQRASDSERARIQPAWKRARELPSFLDSSPSVSASTFGARRLPEIKALWNVAISQPKELSDPGDSLKSSGCKTSSRHLRRRITSHKSRRRQRYPDANHSQLKATTTATIPASRKTWRGHKSNLRLLHESWWRTVEEEEKNPERKDSPNTAKTGNPKATTPRSAPVHWLVTHLWHAKRFHMAKLWGWQIPMVHNNRGPKAALRLIRQGKTLLQDVSYSMAASPIVCRGVNQIVGVVKRLCPEITLDQLSSTKQVIRGQGMFYKLDQFPHQAIGPVTWMATSGRPLTSGCHETPDDSCSLYFWTHPAIHTSVWEELNIAVKSLEESIFKIQSGYPATSSGRCVGLSCFNLRGIHATSTLQKILADADSEPGNKVFWDDPDLHYASANGTAFTAIINLEQEAIESSGSTAKVSSSMELVGDRKALLISHCVRDPKHLSNAPALGWDLYCDTTVAGALFVALTVAGGACPIGVVEEAYIHLECQPPVNNSFPRDFVETREGQEYWEVGGDGDLKVLRLCLENEGGRVDVPTIKARAREDSKQTGSNNSKISIHQLDKIKWSGLTKEKGDEDSTGNECVVMMRGLFGHPLVNALACSGKVAETCATNPKRRNRRRKRHPNELCHAMPLGREQADAHLKQCTALLQSLSLPAVIACALQAVGAGALKPGASIYAVTEDGTNASLLGYVTAGCFSVSQGRSHGSGVIGASRFLRTIIACLSNLEQSRRALAVVDLLGTRSIQLVVQVVTGTAATGMQATLELQL